MPLDRVEDAHGNMLTVSRTIDARLAVADGAGPSTGPMGEFLGLFCWAKR
jgi:hypothetical protein